MLRKFVPKLHAPLGSINLLNLSAKCIIIVFLDGKNAFVVTKRKDRKKMKFLELGPLG